MMLSFFWSVKFVIPGFGRDCSRFWWFFVTDNLIIIMRIFGLSLKSCLLLYEAYLI